MFFEYSCTFWKGLSSKYVAVSKFLSEKPEFKENVLICIIIVIKVLDLELALLSNNNTCSIVSKMNEQRLLILINTSYMINY